MRQWGIITTENNPDFQEILNALEEYKNEEDTIKIAFTKPKEDPEDTDEGSLHKIKLYKDGKVVAKTSSDIKEYFNKDKWKASFTLPDIEKGATKPLIPQYYDPKRLVQVLSSSFKYLTEKHKNICIVDSQEGTDIYGKSILGLYYYTSNDSIIKSGAFLEHFRQCVETDVRFIVIFLGIICIDKIGHANMLLYDTQKSTMERFDPHGYPSSNCNTNKMDENIIKFFNKINPTFIKKYYKPVDFCPKISFQSIQCKEHTVNKTSTDPRGFCLYWSIWYIELRALNPNANIEKLQAEAIKSIMSKETKFTDFIRRYTGIIHEYHKSVLLRMKEESKEEESEEESEDE